MIDQQIIDLEVTGLAQAAKNNGNNCLHSCRIFEDTDCAAHVYAQSAESHSLHFTKRHHFDLPQAGC